MFMRQAAATMIVAAFVAGVSLPVYAQSAIPPTNPPLRIGPLALAPVLDVTNFGHDSNVFNQNQIEHPVSDVTAQVSPSVDG